jgi:hypothetical protein
VFPANSYVGFEVDVNQLWLQSRHTDWPALKNSLLDSFLVLSLADQVWAAVDVDKT